MRTVEIVYILNDRYWIPVLVSAKSALLFRGEHSSDGVHIRYNLIVSEVDGAHLSILRKELTSPFSSVRVVEVSGDEIAELPSWHGSKLVWTRCYLDRILPDIQEWLCVCDGDTLWFRDPAELMNIADGYSSSVVFAGSIDKIVDDNSSDCWFVERGLECSRKMYSCLGFALIHLGRLAKFGMPQKLKCFLDKYGVPPWMEQDVFNVMFEGAKGLLPIGWGTSPVEGIKSLRENLAVVHYYGALPWPSKCLRRMLDIHIPWWYLATKVLHLQLTGDFEMNPIKWLCMRSMTIAMQLAPEALLKKFHGSYHQQPFDYRAVISDIDRLSVVLK